MKKRIIVALAVAGLSSGAIGTTQVIAQPISKSVSISRQADWGNDIPPHSTVTYPNKPSSARCFSINGREYDSTFDEKWYRFYYGSINRVNIQLDTFEIHNVSSVWSHCELWW
jgi:hypothetical protein